MPELHPRIARSRQKLADALIALALEHGYENVSIVAVTRLSGVGYTTFFRHYKSIDDLLVDILASHFTALSELVALQPTIYDEAVTLYTFVRDNADLYRLYFELPTTHPAAEYIAAECCRLIEARCEPQPDTMVPFKVAVKYIFQTCQLLMLNYLEELHDYTPEQVAAMHVDLVVKGATSAAVKLRQGWQVEPLAYSPEQTAISGTRSSPFSYKAMDALHPRVARSRQKLADALVALAMERGYENVSIQALTDTADVGYTTFYRHYKSIDALTVDIFQNVIQESFRLMVQENSPIGEAVAIWTHVRIHADLFRVYITLPVEHPAREVMYIAVSNFFSERYEARNPDRVPLEVAVRHMVEAIYDLLVMYLYNMDTYTVSQIATFFNDLIVQGTEYSVLSLREDWLAANPSYQPQRSVC